jgi:hypothetical protein
LLVVACELSCFFSYTLNKKKSDSTPLISSINCTNLKNELLVAKVKGGFLCLSNSEVYPVSMKESTNSAPSKLLVRAFHAELKLIIEKLRNDRQVIRNNGGAVFVGPSGTGKSWSSQAVLVDELRDAEVSGKAVVYFDSFGQRAFVFSKKRSIVIRAVSNINETLIPELMLPSTVLIYDASRGQQQPLGGYPCEILIFSSPNAGNFKQTADNNALLFFVCPNWTVDELKLLEHGYGDRHSPEEIEKLFKRFGGIPRAVVANTGTVADYRRKHAKLLLKGVMLMDDLDGMNADWPSSLLKARYNSDAIAMTPEEAFNKYREGNVVWDYSNAEAMEFVHETYDHASDAETFLLKKWMEIDSKASALHGYWFEHKSRSLFLAATDENTEIKVLEANEGLSKEEQATLMNLMTHRSHFEF